MYLKENLLKLQDHFTEVLITNINVANGLFLFWALHALIFQEENKKQTE